VEINVPGYAGERREDLLVEVRADATARDLTNAIVEYKNDLPENFEYGLIRTMVRTRDRQLIRYLPEDIPLADCGLLDGVTLELADRSLRPAPTLYIDRDQADNDLYLIDERGTHRGRVTRLADGAPVHVGLDPPGDDIGRTVLIDDSMVAEHVLTLTNQRGQFVLCDALHMEGLVLAGANATTARTTLLPGSTISIKRGGTDYVSFVIATQAALHGRSPVGRVQFDVAARRDTPDYPALPDEAARVRAQPKVPEHRQFPVEQVIIPLLIVAALYLATHSTLSLIASPLAAVFPIVSFWRQKKQEKARYREARDKWVAALEKTAGVLAKLAGKEEGNLRLENPPPEVWAVRAYRRLAGLWERDASSEDFLHVRLGIGQLLSRYESRLEEGIDLRDPDFMRIIAVAKVRDVGTDVVRPKLLDVPVTVDLSKYHLGLVGPLHIVDDVAKDILVQISCGHPPGAVGIAALLPASEIAREPYDWLKWLPHTRSGSTLLPAARLMAGRQACEEFLVEMQRLHSERREHRADEKPDSYALVVVHEAAEVDLALLTEVCNLADGLVRVVWLGSSRDTAPKLVTSVVEVTEGRGDADRKDFRESTGMIRSGAETHKDLRFELDIFHARPVRTVRALAGLYDPRSSGASAGVPRSVPLSAVAVLEGITYADKPDPAIAKTFPIPMGVGEAGVLDLDLIKQGPHVLIGGTTGSGKSELLQTLTCGAISRYSPAEVSLFLVDFKGGATFAPFRDLPHVVGYITDLDQRNVNRALDFLRAELRRREERFEAMGNAKEYGDYLERALKDQEERGRILPRLIVMFDEFATIVQDFERDTINAVIDIARRGRSWGVHLILATQQPTRDVVVPQVRGNVNARIALRTPSPEESQTIIDRPEAAHIPQDFQGRALMTLGGNRLVEFQTAFSGAPFIPEDRQACVLVTRFDITAEASQRAGQSPDTDSGTAGVDDRAEDEKREEKKENKKKQLEALVQAVADRKWARSEGAKVLPPALEEKPERPMPAHPRDRQPLPPTTLLLGMRDLPKQQKQGDLTTDLRRGGLCIVGPNHSGSTSALVMAAEAFARQVSRDPLGSRATIIGIDAADRLREEMDQRFENVVTLSMTRMDEVTRAIDQLWMRIQARIARDGDTDDDRIVLLLIDGLDALLTGLSSTRSALWASRLLDILKLGRRVGIYTCVAARRLRDLDGSAVASQATLITLHGHYENLTTPQEDRLPGFGLDNDGNLVQVFLADAADGQRPRFAFDARMAADFAPGLWRTAHVTPPHGRTQSEDLTVGLGVDELFRQTIPVRLAETHLLVIGGVRSGRTKLLLTLADQLAEQTGAPIAYFSPRGLPGGPRPANIAVITGKDLASIYTAQAAQRATRLADLGVAQLKDGRILLLADDLHAMTSMEDGSTVNNALDMFYKQSMIQLIAATTATSLGSFALGPTLKSSGVTAYLRPTADPSEFDNGHRVRGTSLRHRPGVVYKKGDVIIQTDETQFVAHVPELRETRIMP
jgi:S-DNA-T family DNA segregation ATPase FtsK/SpoIIIE